MRLSLCDEISMNDIICNFLLEKSLSAKILINKEDFKIVSEFLVRMEFDFWVVKWVKCLILVGFDDMGYDKGFGWVEFGTLLNFCGFLGDLKLSECVE